MNDGTKNMKHDNYTEIGNQIQTKEVKPEARLTRILTIPPSLRRGLRSHVQQHVGADWTRDG